jgi:hypothetical protein
MPANDNTPQLSTSIDRAVAGQALTIRQPHRKFGQAYAAFVGHVGDGRHVLVHKLLSGKWRARWTKPLKVERTAVIKISTHFARPAGAAS